MNDKIQSKPEPSNYHLQTVSLMEPKPISNTKLTLIRKLNRKKYRHKEQLFTIEGERAVEQIIRNGLIQLEGLFFDGARQLWSESYWQEGLSRFDSYTVEHSDFQQITDTDNPQGVLALCRMPPESSAQDLAEKQGMLIATDGIQDPGNLGTMIRTASWFGVDGILTGKGTVDLFHPKVVRSTAGATGALLYLNADLHTDLARFEQEGWKVVLLDAGAGAQDLRTLEKYQKVILVVGNEANGIDQRLATTARIRGCIHSPASAPAVESLNASVALSIAIYTFT